MEEKEIELNVEPGVLAMWKQDPVTVKVMEFITAIRDAHTMAPIHMPTMSYTSDQIAINLARIQGVVDGINQVLNLRYEE